VSENEAVEVLEEAQVNVESNFPIGCRIQVIEQHRNHGGKMGTVQRHTAFFIWVQFETSVLMISPRFLLRVYEEDDDDDDSSSTIETNEMTTLSSTLTPRISLLKTSRVSITPSRSTVKFNMEHNCFASYDEDDPQIPIFLGLYRVGRTIKDQSSNTSNIVEPEEIEDDDVTLLNEKVLAEWDDFSDNVEEDDEEEEEEEPILLYGQ
jgi:hypothetical protein